MAYVPGNWRRFLIILVELFIILKLYDILKEGIGISFNVYLVIVFVLFWLMNIVLSKIEFHKGVQDTLLFKVMPRMIFNSDWFGIGAAAAIIAGFFFSKLLGSAFIVYLAIALFAIFSYALIYRRMNIFRHSRGLIILGFLFGIAIGNRFTNTVFVVAAFLICGFVLYMTTTPGEI